MSRKVADRLAIVGMACRFAEASDPEQLWHNVMGRRRSFRRIPPERLPLAEYGGPGDDLTYVTHAALLDDWHFDRQHFRVPGETYRAVDTSHWLALEVSALALSNAGFPGGDGLDRDRVGVVLGNSLTGEFSRAAVLRTRWPYVRRAVAAALAVSEVPPGDRVNLLDAIERQYKLPFPAPSDETLAGALSNTIAGRVCGHFDFRGTGHTVDGACASSLLALSIAADSVAAGRLDVALAGGVDLSIDPFELVGFARLGALARDDMRVYDRHPTGFLPGEGCGVVVLCRESYAHRHGLRPYAYLLGWGTSSDGSGGLTRPDVAGQRLALRRAYERARLEPSRVALVEGHGTGTEVGDRTELMALREVRGPATAHPAALGSIKANIGHTKAAAGVAGLIKAALAVHREVLPATTGCEEPHPLLTDGPLQILDEARPWPGSGRYAAVSAMGFGGINVHAVLGGTGSTSRRWLSRSERHLGGRHPAREVVVCAADRPAQLAMKLARLRDAATRLSRGELTDLAATFGDSEPGTAPARFAAAVADPDELGRAVGIALDLLAAGEHTVIDPVRRVFLAVGGPLRVGLMFSGQASPCYPDAGALADLLGEALLGYDTVSETASDPVVDTATAQPSIMRAALAGLRWLEAIGVRAHAALGHSLGELGALVWAGALDAADAYTLARARGAAMAAVDTGPAGMASLRTDPVTAKELLRDRQAVLAADNGDQIVVSGTRAEVTAVIDTAAQRGIGATWLPVAHAFHSPLMAPAANAVRTAAAAINWRTPQRPVVSTVTGTWLTGEDPVELLARQLTGPVRFREALALMRADLLVEVGPGQVLAGLAGPRAVSLDAGAPTADGIATVTAALFAAGVCPSIRSYFARRATRRFDIDRPRAFLVNPCGMAGPTDVAPPEPATVTSAGAQVEHFLRDPAQDPSHPADLSDPVGTAIARIARAAELDTAAVRRHSRLLADLHLSSLRVGRLAAEVAADLGRAIPTAPLALATTTVEEFAEAIAVLPPADTEDPPASGIASWVRVFAEHRVPEPAPDTPVQPRQWDVVGDLARHPFAVEIRAAFPTDVEGVPARLLALPPGLATPPIRDIVAALRACHADRRPLTVLHHGGVGAAVGRSLAAEEPEIPVLVVEVPPDREGIASAAAEAHHQTGPYAEVVYEGGDMRMVPVLRPQPVGAFDPTVLPLSAGETCVVTGGGKGIAAECAAALAAVTGARMILLGRSHGADATVRATLAQVARTGAPVEYHAVDVTDTAAVAAALRRIREQHGPVRALLHAAGHNAPARIPDLTEESLRAALAPKADGLDNILAALDLTRLRLAVTFGSVIGRTGLAGQAGYAIANEYLARRCARLAVEAPHVRWLNVEWSAWSGTGMGVRLGVLDGLIRQGLSPISMSMGVDVLLRLLTARKLPPTLLVSGRLPDTPTMRWHGADMPNTGRFIESPLVRTPGVEVVAAANLSLGTDPYLADHRIDGVLVLPAVVGLEAMAQACAVLGADLSRPIFTDVALAHPVTVPDQERRVLRTAALSSESGDIEVAVRSDETGFTVDHFRGRYRARTVQGPPGRPRTMDRCVRVADHPTLRSHPELPAGDLYGPLFFHGPRFRRVLGYHALSAYRCLGSVAADPAARWFGAFLDQHLTLGDPGARDAFLHILQGCVPDRRVLPVAVQHIRMHQRPAGQLLLDARQADEDGDDFVFDLTVTDAGGVLVEEWYGVALRAVGDLEQSPWPVELLGACLTRALRRWQPDCRVDLAVARAERTDGERSLAVAGWLAGAAVTRATDGRLLPSGSGSVSASHLADHILVATGPGQVAIDWEVADEVPPPLGPADRTLADQLSRVTGDPSPGSAWRVWTCREVLRKLGLGPDVALVQDRAGPATWVALRADGHVLHSVIVESTAGAVAVCVGTG